MRATLGPFVYRQCSEALRWHAVQKFLMQTATTHSRFSSKTARLLMLASILLPYSSMRCPRRTTAGAGPRIRKKWKYANGAAVEFLAAVGNVRFYWK
jgi:hypothetical protein